MAKSKDTIRYNPVNNKFTGITAQDKKHWLKKYPHIDDFDWTVIECEAWLSMYPKRAKKAQKEPRKFLDRFLSEEWVNANIKAEPIPEPKTPAELAEQINYCHTFCSLRESESDFDMIQAEKEYAIFHRLAYQLGIANLPKKTGNPYYDLTELQRHCKKAAETKPGQPKNEEAVKSVDSLEKLLEDESKFSDMPKSTKRKSWEWIAEKIGYPQNQRNDTPRYKIMQGYLRKNSPQLYAKLKSIVEEN